MEYAYSDLQRYALCLVQALLGVVSKNFRLVSISLQSQTILVRIILAAHCGEDMEEIEDFKTEFEALLPGATDYEVEVVVSQEPISWPDESAIVVFRRRE